MRSRGFWSLPEGWRATFPQGLLLGVLVVVGMVAAEALRGGFLDRIFWVEAVVLFPVVVVIATAILAGRRRGRDNEPDDGESGR